MIQQIIQFDYSLLRGKIREFFGTEKNFAEKLSNSSISISAGAFSNKINNKTNFTQPEIYFICDLLNIAHEDIPIYFFKEKYELNS